MDEVDEDLLALPPPPPNPRFLIFVLMILTMSVVMMVWFFPELRYFLSAFREPLQLGEAADLDPGKLEADRLAEVDGFPLIQRTLTYKEGVKWFMMSDNMRKIFPLAGQPHLFVQWAESAAHKAYRDPETNPGVLGPPSHFRGHLVTREGMGTNYDGVWVFYDCLKFHYLGRCNYCLGRTSLDECRKSFVCAESNGPEACGEILSRSEGPVQEEIEASEKRGDSEAKERLTQILSSLKENAVLTRSVELEELGIRAGRLQDRAVWEKSPLTASLDKIRGEIIKIRTAELEIRAVDALRTISTLDEAKKQTLRSLRGELDTLTTDEADLVSTLKTMKVLVQMGDGIHRWKKRTTAIMEKAAILPLSAIEKHAEFDPATPKGTVLLDTLSALESEIADKERALKLPSKTASDDTDQDTGASVTAAENSTDTAVAPATPPVLDGNPKYELLKTKLNALASRFRALEIRLGNVLPGQLPALEKWAKKPDVLGNTPDALMEPRVLAGISEIERMTAAVSTAVDTPEEPDFVLAREMNDKIDQLNAMRARMKKIPTTPGFNELKIADLLTALQKSLSDTMSRNQASVAAGAIDGLIADMITHNLYLANLKGAPDALNAIGSLITEEKLKSFKADLAPAIQTLEPTDFVLIDGEIPMDKLWVVLIYLVLLTMAIVNIRKVIRFVDAYRK